MFSHDSHIYTLHERPKLIESTSSHGSNFVSLIITVPRVSAPLVCHCRNCGRSGGGSSINYVLPEADVTIKDPHSSLKAYEDTNTVSGNRIQRKFCSNYGSPGLTGGPSLIVMASLFDVISRLDIEVFTDQSQKWEGPAEGAKQAY
ncbi:hypothetical protein BDV23DRAFT_131228 [Aspergillus alliaceus]|uniref:CENP-V/GFA domain-containing protein n=1 Tax=Petromyces alliaceus TaxID=209559 RepID=A0A5N7BZE9_PETAA|nr:hypothetical protein BDV23DRAFT_131228 [Aspergillus alliaceus]